MVFSSDELFAGQFPADYPNGLRILVVGDGDFSFSFGFVKSGRDGAKITATSFQKFEEVVDMYKDAAYHIGKLLIAGVKVLFEVDGTTMKDHPKLSKMRFDIIVFNFPHAGFFGFETSRRAIGAHRNMLRSFFKNAAPLLTRKGEVHVTHQTDPPYSRWNLPQLANEAGLMNFETSPFNINDYPGYENKRGAGRRAHKTFDLGPCAKFKFKRIN